MRGALALLFAGCAPVAPAPCGEVGEPGLEIAPVGVAFGDFADGSPLPYGNPPQGGAPYTALHARVTGLVDLDQGVTIALSGWDPEDGAALGALEYPTRLVCANVGDSAGSWRAADVHFRYFGWSLDALVGRSAEILFLVRDVEGNEVEAALFGVLQQQ